MAGILYLLREEASRTLLENGSTTAAALQVGELGFNNDSAALEFSYKRRNGAGFVHIPTSERLAFAAAALTSGAKGVGYFPTSPLTATNLQDAMDQLAGLTGGGGGVGGTLTTGKLPKASAANTLTDSILSESSGKILFSGDAVANLYRAAAGILETDGALILGGGISIGAGILAVGDAAIGGNIAVSGNADLEKYISMAAGYAFDNASANAAAAVDFTPQVTKSNSNTRQFYGLRLKPTFNTGGSGGTFDTLEIDSVNASVVGMAVNPIKVSYGGATVFKLAGAGDLSFANAADTANLFASLGFASNRFALLSNRGLKLQANNNYVMELDAQGGGMDFMRSGHAVVSLVGPGAGDVSDNYLHVGSGSNSNAFIKYTKVNTGKEPTVINANEVNVFLKGNSIVFQYLDGVTVRYKYLDLTGTGTTWTHSTTAP